MRAYRTPAVRPSLLFQDEEVCLAGWPMATGSSGVHSPCPPALGAQNLGPPQLEEASRTTRSQARLSHVGSGGPERAATCPRLRSQLRTARTFTSVGSCVVMRLMGTKAMLTDLSLSLTASPLRQGCGEGH